MRFLAFIGAVAILVGIGAAVFFFGGFFNVAATAEDPPLVNWALIHVRQASIAKHAVGMPAIPSDDATIQAGAKAYLARGCVNCHGAPGADWAKFSEGLNPGPPDLSDVAKLRTPGEIFFIVKNGIKMTGMPSFATAGVDDKEITTIAAFVKKLPDVKDTDFKAWTAK